MVHCQYIHTSFLLTSAAQLLLHTGITGGSSLQGQVVPVLMSPRAYKQLALCSSSCLRLLFFLNHLDSLVGIWLFGSFFGRWNIISLFLFGLLHCCYCLHVLDVPLFLRGWKYVGTGSWVCAAVAVPADAAPDHCPSDSATLQALPQPSTNPGLSNPGEFQTEFPGPCPAVSILCISWEAALKLREETCSWSTHFTTCSTFCPKNLLVYRKPFHRSSRMALLRCLGLSCCPYSCFP